MRSREPGGASPGGEPALLEILNTSSCSSTQNEARANPSLSSVPASCTLCLVVSNSVVRGLKSFFAEFVNDPKSRVVFRASRGFCRGHVPLLYSTGDPLGIAILYADLADATLIRWNGASPTKRGALISRSAARLAPCPACTLELEANSRYSGALAAGLSDESVWNCVEKDLQICADHVEQVANLAKPEHARRLYMLEAKKLELLRGELNEVIRKNDYRFRSEEWGAERDAWVRALAMVTRPNKPI